MVTTPTLWKDLGQVNTGDVGATGDFQFDPVVTGLANGNFLVAYTDDSNSVDSDTGTDIIGRLYDAEGQALGNSFQLNSFRNIHEESDPEIAALSDGGFVMVYEDFDTAVDIIFQKYNANGTSVDTGTVAFDPAGADGIADPKVAVFSDDSFVVVYTRSVGAGTDVRARIVDSSGTVGSEITIRTGSGDPREPTVTVLENDNFVVSFVEDDPAGAGIEFSILDSSGGFVRSGINVVSPQTDENEEPYVEALTGGGFVIAWTNETNFADENIYARVFNASGTDISGLVNVATNADDDAEPSVAALNDGGFMVIYDDDGTEAIRGRRFDASGNTVGAEITLQSNGELVNTPEVAALGDGRFVATWQIFETPGNDFEVEAAIWDPRDNSISGTTGNDVLTGRQNASTVFGLNGDDTLFGVSGNDSLYGGNGQDSVFGGSGNDTIFDTDNLSGDTHDGGSGIDFIDFSQDSFGSFVTIDLGVGIASFSGGQTDFILNFENARTSRSASLLGSSGNNSLFGTNTGNNYIRGRSGDDRIYGIGGTNRLFGNAGYDNIFGGTYSDSLFGGSGNDSLYASDGDDTAYGGEGTDRIFGGEDDDLIGGLDGNDILYGDTGNDTVSAGSGGDLVLGREGTDTLFGGSGNDNLQGDSGNDLLDGSQGNDFLFGSDGSDTLVGGLGVDTGFAGTGSDRFFGGSGNDFVQVGLGTDTVFGASGTDVIQFTGGNNLFYGGVGDDFALGANGSARLYGGSGIDRFAAASGDDVFFGGSGLDSLFGDSGSDRFVIRSGEQVLGEMIDGGSGSDTIEVNDGLQLISDNSYTSIELADFFGTDKNDSLRGTDFAGRDILRGLSGDDDIRAGDGGDTLFGGSGRNALRGEAGDDTMVGGDSNDTMLGADGDDIATGLRGRDIVAGGSGSDIFFGGSGRDRLNGGSGVDTVEGGSGDDTFIVDSAGDVLRETANGGLEDVIRSNADDYTIADGFQGHIERANINNGVGPANLRGNAFDNTLLGNTSDNRLFGNSGDDILNGQQGVDWMVGGSGDDTVVVDTVTDDIREFAGEGTDLVRTDINFTLPDGGPRDFFENLRLQGNSNLNGGGNGLDNSIQGNDGDNDLRGFTGADTLSARDGDDRLFGGGDGGTMEGESGNDTLYMGQDDVAFGGSGMDNFRFNGASLGFGGSGGPVIRDFDGEDFPGGNGEDKLVFATGLEVGSFAYINGQAFSASGNSEARFAGNRQLQVDQDGDGTVDQAILIDGFSIAGRLTATDFVWL
ncbi:MAG: calcium-binding protein [Pseudomonadota bacterium]